MYHFCKKPSKSALKHKPKLTLAHLGLCFQCKFDVFGLQTFIFATFFKIWQFVIVFFFFFLSGKFQAEPA